jgi:hypothetical protein
MRSATGDVTMRGFTKNNIARSILPYAATILSASLVVTLRVEHACTDSPSHDEPRVPRAVYPFPEMIPIGFLRSDSAEVLPDEPRAEMDIDLD